MNNYSRNPPNQNRNYNVEPPANRPVNQNLSPNPQNPFLNAYRQTYQNQAPSTPAVRPEYVPNSPALANQQKYNPNQRLPPKNPAPVYKPDPRNNARVGGGGVYAPPPPALPRPLPLKSSESNPQIINAQPSPSAPSEEQPGPPPPVPADFKLQQQTLQNRVSQLPGNFEHGEAKKSGSNGIFADLVGGLKLPELKMPSFGGIFGGNSAPKEKSPRSQHRNDGSRVNGEAIPVSLGVKPQIKSDVSKNKTFSMNFDILYQYNMEKLC